MPSSAAKEEIKMTPTPANETRSYKSSKTSYASKYYDPQKAHEYYLQNRQLKGYSTAGLNDDAKANWAYAKKNISDERKSKQESAKASYTQKIQYYRNIAAERKKKLSSEILETLKSISDDAERRRLAVALNQKLERARLQESGKQAKSQVAENAKKQLEQETEKTAKNKQRISDEHDSRIESLISKLKSVKLQSERRRLLAEIDKETADKNTKIDEEVNRHAEANANIKQEKATKINDITELVRSALASSSESASEERQNIKDETSSKKEEQRNKKAQESEMIRNTLNTSIAQVRAEYKSNLDQIKQEYQDAMDTTYNEIVGATSDSGSSEVIKANIAKMRKARMAKRNKR